MERKRWIRSEILTYLKNLLIFTATIISQTGCSDSKEQTGLLTSISVAFDTGNLVSRSADPAEERLSDISLWVLDEYGRIEEYLWIDKSPGRACSLSLISGKKYRFIACANFGYKINIRDAYTLDDIRFHLAYPDEYKNGIPMVADTGYICIPEENKITLKFIRLMSKISIRIDRSRLSEDVEMNICGIRIGNCPRSASIFQDSYVRNSDDCFPLGFSKEGEECNALNIMENYGISYSATLYMLENIQGRFSETPISNDSEKTFDTYDPRLETCSYIELDIDYLSSDKASKNGFLKYRFYLGEDRNDLSIERNCHYQITVTPEDDGLKEDSWRVDKSCITSTLPPTFSYYPESYIRGDIGDVIHLGCDFTPEDAPFDIGLSYMESDRQEGIYDYNIDEDGHGATIRLTGPGSGLIYMSVGSPVNESALWFIEVNQPNGAL